MLHKFSLLVLKKSIENSKGNMDNDVRLSRVKANYTNLDHVSRSQSSSFKEHTGKIFSSFILFVSFHSFQKLLDQWMSWVNLQCSLLVGIISERKKFCTKSINPLSPESNQFMGNKNNISGSGRWSNAET